MGAFLNSRGPYERYKAMVSDIYFVDKSALLTELIPALGKPNKYFCITRPRRFGKSVMADMVGAFLGKPTDGSSLFDGLSVAKGRDGKENPDYRRHLNQYNLIYIDFSVEPKDCQSYGQYIDRIQDGINIDLIVQYPDVPFDADTAVWDALNLVFQKKGEKFVFVIDEWDAVFHLPYVSGEEQKAYLRFLRSLLKGQVYVELVYMTGVLPIAKYSSGSELNMFVEYDMATRKKFSESFGFLECEVDRLFEIYQSSVISPEITREDLRSWYDGYYTVKGTRLYNPRSVICALLDDELACYWTSSGPYDEIFYYIRNNVEAVRDDLVLMISGEGVKAKIESYAASSMELNTKDEIYSAMVVYGLLTYKEGRVYIPNRELMKQYEKLLISRDSLGYVYRLAKESEKMLEATLKGNTKTMAQILKYVHDTESPIFSYNSEIELSAVVNLVYLAARNEYRVEREDKAGEGYVDFIFYPERKGADALILELKIDSTPDEAIAQIKEKKYALRFQGKLGEKQKYTGRILAVGISYSKKTKEHVCKIEEL
ncbi:MAG: ATP-binding protein [Lachnospiraceae bacterium]